MIKRYTTPYHHFVLPFLIDDIKKIVITYSQNGTIIVTKSLEDESIVLHDITDLLDNASMGDDQYIEYLLKKVDNIYSSSLATIHFTQEETSQFTFFKAEEKNIAVAQIRIISNTDDAFVSRPILIRVRGSINEGVL